MKLLGRRNDGADDAGADDAETEITSTPEAAADPAARMTAPKGRPTPKRNDKTKKRGPVAPAPMTAAEARQRRKEMRKTMTKEERKAAKVKQRAVMATQRERMMAGEEAYLMPRDKGPVRAYVRDLVDSRRNLLGLFLPLSLMLIFFMLALPKLAVYSPPFTLALMVAMFVDGFLLWRKVNKAVDAKFPDNTESSRKLGLYAVSRATQLRRSRVPRPRVERGATVA
ncbi:MAG: DUF3043 domain-containing protein [Mycobacterium sp.]|nr:DUF3043 domain-containing protein [Mycobacterium sp.]